MIEAVEHRRTLVRHAATARYCPTLSCCVGGATTTVPCRARDRSGSFEIVVFVPVQLPAVPVVVGWRLEALTVACPDRGPRMFEDRPCRALLAVTEPPVIIVRLVTAWTEAAALGVLETTFAQVVVGAWKRDEARARCAHVVAAATRVDVDLARRRRQRDWVHGWSGVRSQCHDVLVKITSTSSSSNACMMSLRCFTLDSSSRACFPITETPIEFSRQRSVMTMSSKRSTDRMSALLMTITRRESSSKTTRPAGCPCRTVT